MTTERKNVLIIGHKNPDSDSICSAIAYAALKNALAKEGKALDCNYVPMRAGQINNETKFILEKFSVTIPQYIEDVGTQIGDINVKKTPGVDKEISLKQAWSIMKNTSIATLPVTRGDVLEGLVSVKDIATANMDIYDTKILGKAKTPIENVLDALDGTLVVGDPAGVITDGKILVGAGNIDLLEEHVDAHDIVILGNRYDAQLCAIESGARYIVLCMGAPISTTIRKMAEENHCAIISTKHDTYIAAKIINQATPIRYFMKTDELVTFTMDSFIEEVKPIMAKIRHRDFPILDNAGRYQGMISRRSLLDIDKKKIILVDHNEKTQAVDNVENAQVLEIIDHHRICTLETISPIYFRNQPLGCTATIIYQMYKERGIKLEKDIAAILCAAIISDTLMFRSPTCTAPDRITAEKLSEIAGLNIESFAEEMFTAGSNLKNQTAQELFYQDYKQFTAGEFTFGVGQISAMNKKIFETVKPEILAYMNETFTKQGVDMIFFMLTDIREESTQLLFVGENAKEYASSAFGITADKTSIILPGIVSRKKQLIPPLMSSMQEH